MKNAKLLAAAVGAFVILPALAEDASQNPVTSNVTLVNNYVRRGISQTGNKPAIQAGFDYMNPNGVYLGVWGSNASMLSDKGIGNSSLELDTYIGIKNSFAADFTYDLGYLRYNYPGTYAPGVIRGDTDEIYAALGYQWISFKYSYSLGNTFGIADAKGSNYWDLSLNYPIPDSHFALGGHYGRQTYKGAAAEAMVAAQNDPSYGDYKVSVSYNLEGYVFAVSYTRALVSSAYYIDAFGNNLGKATVLFSLNHTM